MGWNGHSSFYFLHKANGRQMKEDIKPRVTNASVTMILFDIIFCLTSPSFKQILLSKTRKHDCQARLTTKHASNSPVLLVKHKRLAVLFSLPSCCVSSLLTRGAQPRVGLDTNINKNRLNISPKILKQMSKYPKKIS